jgi:hypothetical protein
MTRTSATEYIKLTGSKLRETEKAVHFRVINVANSDIEPVTHWFPLSQIKSMTTSPDQLDDADTIEVADWICRSKELV